MSKAGDYALTFRYACKDARNMVVSVNGTEASLLGSLNTGSDLEWQDVNIKVKLDKGFNTIRLSNPASQMPDIDCMTVKKM